MATAELELQLFWDRYRVCHGHNNLFQLSDEGKLSLRRTVPLFLHGDEGRGRKRSAVMILSAHSPIGAGVDSRHKYKKTAPSRRPNQEMNYIGSTYCTRFCLAVLPKTSYGENDSAFHCLLEKLSEDMSLVTSEGLLGPDGRKYWAAPIAMKGDWPFLAKAGQLQRSFHNQPKHGHAKKTKPCPGVCHLCEGGKPSIPFEDLSIFAEWQFHMGVIPPWDSIPNFILNCCRDVSYPETFLAPDPWHTWHLGEGRNFCSNAIALITSTMPQGNIDAKLDALYEQYRQYCRRNQRQTYASKFTMELFNVKGTEYPTGGWTKGNFTTSLMKFVEFYLHRHEKEFEPDSLFVKTVSC